jgi:hypothetical protein
VGGMAFKRSVAMGFVFVIDILIIQICFEFRA